MDPAFWAETVRLLRGTFPSMGTFLSWGTDREREECLAIRELAGGRVMLLPRLGYKALAAVYRACGHMIGPDTGPLHLAAVVGSEDRFGVPGDGREPERPGRSGPPVPAGAAALRRVPAQGVPAGRGVSKRASARRRSRRRWPG